MEKLVYQMFIAGTGEYLNSFLEKGLGGVIFFTRDIESKESFIDLIRNVKSKSIYPPFLSIDQEGGRVERTENIHERYLSPRYAFLKGEKFLKEQTEQIAHELIEYGINLNFAPCADVQTNPDNPIIGERAFSDKTEEVIKGVKIVSDIYRKNGIIPCVKHYPGHGDADKDSHLTLPEIDLSMEDMKKYHIKPFEEAVKDGADMIMAAHLWCKCFDKEVLPSSLSRNAIGYLRKELNYDGVIISDDMVMKGVQQYGSAEAVIKGIDAGLDMFIFRYSDSGLRDAILQVTEKAENDSSLREKIEKSNERILKLKEKYGIEKG